MHLYISVSLTFIFTSQVLISYRPNPCSFWYEDINLYIYDESVDLNCDAPHALV